MSSFNSSGSFDTEETRDDSIVCFPNETNVESKVFKWFMYSLHFRRITSLSRTWCVLERMLFQNPLWRTVTPTIDTTRATLWQYPATKSANIQSLFVQSCSGNSWPINFIVAQFYTVQTAFSYVRVAETTKENRTRKTLGVLDGTEFPSYYSFTQYISCFLLYCCPTQQYLW